MTQASSSTNPDLSAVFSGPLWDGHCRRITDAILSGNIIPFLGSDINLCNRPVSESGVVLGWKENQSLPPSNQELALYLDEVSCGMGPTYRQEIRCPFMDTEVLEDLPTECPLRKAGNNLRLPLQDVSQYVATLGGVGERTLYDALITIGNDNYELNDIHRFFAVLPSIIRRKTSRPRFPIIVTTCFDSALEQAFQEAGEPFDLVSYIGNSQGGRFRHRDPNGLDQTIDDPNTYTKIMLDKQPTIVRIYGGYASEECVITEDDYIDYLAQKDVTSLLPVGLLSRLRSKESLLWFLGYSPRFWNLRVVLRRLWPGKVPMIANKACAIHSHVHTMDANIWARYSVQVPIKEDIRLDKYIHEIQLKLEQSKSRILLSGAEPSGISIDAERPERKLIFISYAHKDKEWLDRLRTMLSPLIKSDLDFDVWSDTMITPGDKWKEEIKKKLSSARVAVLLVSDDFIDSEFISSEELPYILKAEREDGVRILWIYIRSCLWEYSAIADFQAAHTTEKPLESMSKPEQDQALVDICKRIKQAFNMS